MRVFFISIFDEWCLGVRSISAQLKREGHDVTLAYLRSNSEMHDEAGKDDPDGFHVPPGSVTGADFDALMRLVKDCDPELIGLTFTSNFTGVAERVTNLLRGVTKAPVIWGGVDATSNPDVAIATADMVCLGEGEGAMSDLTAAMAAGEDTTAIPNLWVRRGETIHRNALRPLIQDVDSLVWTDFEPKNKYWISEGEIHPNAYPADSHLHHSFPLMATRGCPYTCTFCCNSLYRDMYGNKDYVRMRSVEDVIGEIESYLKANPHIGFIEFFDDVFGTRADWVEEFSYQYRDRIGLPFWCYTYPAFCKPKLVNGLKRAGVDFVVMGIQTGSQKTLREIYLRNSPEKVVVESAKLLMDAGIRLVVDLIGSNPFETEEGNLETLELLLQLPEGFVMQEVNPLTFYRNFPVSKKAEEAGLLTPWIHGRNATVANSTPNDRFWNALHALTQFPQIGKDNLRLMARDTYMREHPEALEGILHSMIEMTYLPGTRLLRSRQTEDLSRQADDLTGKLARYEGSRAVKLYFGAKEKFGFSTPHGPNGGNGGSGNGNGSNGKKRPGGSTGAAARAEKQHEAPAC